MAGAGRRGGRHRRRRHRGRVEELVHPGQRPGRSGLAREPHRRRVVRLVLHRADDGVGPRPGLPRPVQHDVARGAGRHHLHLRLGSDGALRRLGAAAGRDRPVPAEPPLGHVGGGHRDDGRRGRGGVAGRARVHGLVRGALPEHDVGPVVLPGGLDGRVQRALHHAAQPDLVARGRRPRLHDAHRRGAPDQLPGGGAEPGSGAGRGRRLRGAERDAGEHGGHGAHGPGRGLRAPDLRGCERRALGRARPPASRDPLGDPPGRGGDGGHLGDRRVQSRAPCPRRSRCTSGWARDLWRR